MLFICNYYKQFKITVRYNLVITVDKNTINDFY